MNITSSRRRLLKFIAATPLLGPQVFANERKPTPAQTAGPFYPEHPEFGAIGQPTATIDSNLIAIGPGAPAASGQPLRLRGKVVNINGQPIENAIVQIWQCDATGHYHHSADRPEEKRDDNFQGFGQTLSDVRGDYEFQTIVPVPYPGRTPHIHFAVIAPSYRTLTTQMYLADHSGNLKDVLYGWLSRNQQRALTVPLEKARRGETTDEQQAYFEIVLA